MLDAVEIVGEETIKPSSPTPLHLRTFNFSLLDQLLPCPYAPLVLFYPTNDHTSHLDTTQKLNLLKNSLSMTLTQFYPLAGKMRDDLSIDCNDEGAYFAEARVNCCLDKFLSQPDLFLVQRFLPCEVVLKGPIEGTFVANIQVNVFECGGMAIGLCISHKILDGAALGSFLKAWSAMARGADKAIYPDFSASSIFPANDLWLRDSAIGMWSSFFKPGKCITRRFVFDASAIAKLKAQAKGPPTRVEAVSAFLWKCTISASTKRHGCQRPSLISHLVNMRKRMVPALSGNTVGNLLWIASAQCSADHNSELHDLVGEVRDAISKIDHKFVKKLRGCEQNSVVTDSFKALCKLDDGVDYLGFTSWCKLGFYEADFGWGKPVWVSSYGVEGPMVMNLVILADTRCGQGIEAWVTLDEHDVNILEHDAELNSLASIDPSPLNAGAYFKKELMISIASE